MYYQNNFKIDETSFTKDTSIVNQTRKYLTAQFSHYGIELLKRLKEHEVKGIFLQDYGINFSPESRVIKPEIYFLFDVNGVSQYGHYIDLKGSRANFMRDLPYFRSLPYFVADYPFDSNKDGHYHIIILRMPFPDKLEKFLKGQYSKMYTSEEIDKWFPKEYTEYENGKETKKKVSAYQVVSKDPEYFEIFKEKVKEEFGVRDSSISDLEFDFPPYLPNEILRYNTSKERL